MPTRLPPLLTAILHDLRLLAGQTGCWLALFVVTITSALQYNGFVSLWKAPAGFLPGTGWYALLFFAFYAAGWLFNSLHPPDPSSRHTRRLCWILLIAPLLFALKITVPFPAWSNPTGTWRIGGEAARWLGGWVLITGSLGVLHFVLEGRPGLYYVRRSKQLRPYLLMLLLMTPLVVLVSNWTSFTQAYPRAQHVTQLYGSAARLADYLLFETAYLLDFVSIELFFRGFLIAAVSQTAGRQVLLPAALFYFSIHLGKPAAEAIGSFFGALVLGSAARHTHSIWGGWLVHAGIALLLELLAAVF
ncbi:MAG TPA: CPBP family intramembrane metalloprotease [Lacibacter sp.]|nr:CPBP family intramembrane metalloprotease [Lacibacter sp.]HMO88535.1 CPBP family intramembrane metalloprotease [Lacibacter sp.]